MYEHEFVKNQKIRWKCMPAIGKIPENIILLNALDVIGETIIIADSSYTIRWMNNEACRLMGEIAPLYGM